MTIHDFVQRVCVRAEANMEKTGKLEGAHYAAMMAELATLEEGESMTLQHTKDLYHILAPLEGVEPAQLRRVAAGLVGRGGEFTACGRCLERAADFLWPTVSKPEGKGRSFEEGYSSITFPLGPRR